MTTKIGHRSHVNGSRGKRLLQRRQDNFDAECKRLETELKKPCQRQVYASLEVAEGMVRSLKAMGIAASVERCEACKLMHVNEVRR